MMVVGVVCALLIAALVAAALCTWLIVGPGLWRRHVPRHGRDTASALRRHPASRGQWAGHADEMPGGWPGVTAVPAGPTGPDDDPEFIRALERMIRGGGFGAQD
jgi:hypothetical protein